jgi:hypothetical protein
MKMDHDERAEALGMVLGWLLLPLGLIGSIVLMVYVFGWSWWLSVFIGLVLFSPSNPIALIGFFALGTLLAYALLWPWRPRGDRSVVG